jgi:hypothetical protein
MFLQMEEGTVCSIETHTGCVMNILAVERVAPSATVDLMALIPIDMPEAAIDQRMVPIGLAAAPTTH